MARAHRYEVTREPVPPPPVYEYSLVLSEDERAAVLGVIGEVAGPPGGPRSHTDKVYRALLEADDRPRRRVRIHWEESFQSIPITWEGE